MAKALMEVLIAFVIGATAVGLITQRQIWVHHGQVLPTVIGSCLVGVSSWFSVHYVAQHEVYNYLAFSLGGVVVTAVMAWKRKLELQNDDK
jgi:hypothetical protein